MSEDCFHLGIKALLVNPEGKILILQRTIQGNQKSWDLPGGRLQKGEIPEQTLKREVFEETSLENLDSIKFVMMDLTRFRIRQDTASVGLIFSVYQCRANINDQITLSEEHCNYQWLEPKEAAAKLEKTYPTRIVHYLATVQSTELALKEA